MSSDSRPAAWAQPRHGSRRRRRLAGLVAVWLVACGLGLSSLWTYSARPGVAVSIATRWPADVRMERAEDRPTLIMAIHPRCPCTHASVVELGRLLARARGAFDARLLVFHPTGSDPAWAEGRVLSLARGMAGLRVTLDEGGAEIARLGVMTSGHVVVYDANGALAFSGGITPGRGHQGSSLGGTALLDLARGPRASSSAPVYGCPIFGPPTVEGQRP